MITKSHVANVSTVWELLPLLPTSRVHLDRKSRNPKKERDNPLITPKDPSNTTASQTSSNTSINKGLIIKRPSFLSWKKEICPLSTASIELVQKIVCVCLKFSAINPATAVVFYVFFYITEHYTYIHT